MNEPTVAKPAKIGKREGGSGLTTGHSTRSASSIFSVMLGFRKELDVLYVKLNDDTGVTDQDYHQSKYVAE